MKVLFIGAKSGNSYLHYLAIKRFYKNVHFFDDRKILPFPKVSGKVFWHVSPLIFENYINNKIRSKINSSYDLIFVKTGHLIGKKLIFYLKSKTKKIICLCNDNPFVKRDKNRWKLFLQAAKYYDLIVYQDASRIKLAKKFKLKNSLLTLPTYDKKTHKKFLISSSNKLKLKNDVIFIGTWSPNKGIFLNKLRNLGLNFKIYGTRWNQDPNYKILKPIIKLGHVDNPKYSILIQNAKIAICLFSEQNLDTITARSIEIPAIGTLLFSLRTKSMKEVFIENKEAIFFKDPNECYKKCIYYLKNPIIAKKIAKRGNKKVTKILKVNNDNLIKNIINESLKKLIKNEN